MVEAAGYPFRAGGEPSEEEVAAIRERLPVASPEEASILGNRELFGRLATEAMLPHMEETFADWSPDLVLREPCEYASAVVAGQLDVPMAQVAISLAEGEAASITAAAPALEAHRTGLVEQLRASPYLTRFPASLDPSPFPCTIRCREPSPSRGTGLPPWWEGSSGPFVYASFGTVLGYMSIAAGVYRAALEALVDLEARVLLTVGRRLDVSSLGAIPGNVRVEAWVDQADIVGHADLVVCHGGSGTAFGALAAGVPLVMVPLFADQIENARRIAASGAGLVVAGGPGRGYRFGEGDGPRLAQAISTVLSDPSYGQAALGIAEEIAGAPSLDAALASLPAAGAAAR